MSRVLLVRSPAALSHLHQIGYGWSQMNFSDYASADELIGAFRERTIDIGRKENQIRRFFNIQPGDLIVVPVNRAILLARATGQKSFCQDVGYGENRIGAEFLRNPDGSLKRVPRNDLSNALETRLKIRMAIAPLDEFSDELERLYSTLEKGGHSSISSHYEAQNNDLVAEAKSELLKRIQKGGTYLASGGEGFERLVMELLELEGYSVHRPSKRYYAGIADADIEAYRQDRFIQTKLLLQVKHHQGTTDAHGIKQLAAIEEEGAQRWLITSALIEEQTKTYAESHDVQVMDGVEFVDWLFEQAHHLKLTTRSRLGLSDAPVLV